MVNNEDYEFLPYKELSELKKEIDALKGGKEISTKELYDAVQKLSQTLADMLEVFGAAAEQMKLEEKERDAELKKHETMVSKLDKLLDQNKTIAEGMLAIVDMVKKNIITSKFEKEKQADEERQQNEQDSLSMLAPEPKMEEELLQQAPMQAPKARTQPMPQSIQNQWQQPQQSQKPQSAPQQAPWATASQPQQQTQNQWRPQTQSQIPPTMQQNPWQLTPQPEINANPSFVEPPKMDSFGPMFDDMPQMPEPTQPNFGQDFGAKLETGMPSMSPEPAPDLDFPDDNFGIPEPKKKGLMGLFKK